MRIATRLKISSHVSIGALLVMAPLLAWSLGETQKAKNDAFLANEIQTRVFRESSLRYGYLLQTGDGSGVRGSHGNGEMDLLLKKAAARFADPEERRLVEEIRRNHDRISILFSPIAGNVERSTKTGSAAAPPDGQKRLFGQLLQLSAGLLDDSGRLRDALRGRVERSLRRSIKLTTMFVVLVAIITAVNSAMLGRRFRQRLLALHSGAEIIAKGNLDYRIPSEGADELVDLARTINLMTERLRVSSHRLLDLNAELELRIDERTRQLSEALDLKRSIIAESVAGIIAFHAENGQCLLANRAAAKTVAVPVDDMVNRNFWEIGPWRESSLSELARQVTASGKPSRRQLHVKAAGGRELWLDCVLTCFANNGEPYMFLFFQDVTDRKLTENRLKELSLTDELTGLYNRRGFLLLAKQQVKVSDRNRRKLALVFADVDRMKFVNDRYGHGEGDRALIDTGRILRNAMRASDIVARLGGDEFVALSIEASEESAGWILERLRENLHAHNLEAKRPHELSISFGIAFYDPEQPCSLEALLEQGDRLMYENKRKMNAARGWGLPGGVFGVGP